MRESHSLPAGQLPPRCCAGGALQAQNNTQGHGWQSRFERIQSATKHKHALTSRTVFFLLIWEQIIQGVLGGVALLLLLRKQESQCYWFSEEMTAAWAEPPADLFSLLQPKTTINFPGVSAAIFLPHNKPSKARFPHQILAPYSMLCQRPCCAL